MGGNLKASERCSELDGVSLSVGCPTPGCFPFADPKMSVRTIYLAIRVVRNSLSDTRSKVSAAGVPGSYRVLGSQERGGDLSPTCPVTEFWDSSWRTRPSEAVMYATQVLKSWG